MANHYLLQFRFQIGDYMETIKIEEIMQLYKKCGLNEQDLHPIRTTINTGSLNNTLNSNYDFGNKTIMDITDLSQTPYDK